MKRDGFRLFELHVRLRHCSDYKRSCKYIKEAARLQSKLSKSAFKEEFIYFRSIFNRSKAKFEERYFKKYGAA